MTMKLQSPTVIGGMVEVQPKGIDMPSKMEVFEVPLNSTGVLLKIEAIGADRNAEDLSGGSAVKFYSRTPEGVAVTADGTGAYTTDGTDGLLQFQLTAIEVSVVRDLWCEFEVIGTATGDIVSKMFILRIEPRAKVA